MAADNSTIYQSPQRPTKANHKACSQQARGAEEYLGSHGLAHRPERDSSQNAIKRQYLAIFGVPFPRQDGPPEKKFHLVSVLNQRGEAIPGVSISNGRIGPLLFRMLLRNRLYPRSYSIVPGCARRWPVGWPYVSFAIHCKRNPVTRRWPISTSVRARRVLATFTHATAKSTYEKKETPRAN